MLIPNYSIPDLLQVAATECGYFQIAILMNRVEYKKQRNDGVSAVKCHLMYAFFLEDYFS